MEREKTENFQISFIPFFRGSAGSEVSGGPNGTVCWPKVTSGPSIGRTATPVRRKSQHHHPDLNQTNDKRRATHYLESDTDMLSVSGGFGGGTFRRPPYCKRYLGITMPISKSADARRVLEHHQNTRPEEKKSPTILDAKYVPTPPRTSVPYVRYVSYVRT